MKLEKTLKKYKINWFEDSFGPMALYSYVYKMKILKSRKILKICNYYEKMFYLPVHNFLNYKNKSGYGE